MPRHAERDGADRHERFVGHGVDHSADDGGLVEAAGEVAVDQIGDAGVGEEAEGGEGLGGEDEVADGGGGEEAREGEDVGDGVDVFVAGGGYG